MYSNLKQYTKSTNKLYSNQNSHICNKKQHKKHQFDCNRFSIGPEKVTSKTHSNSRTIYKLQKNEHMWQKYIQNSKQIYKRLKIDIDHNKVIQFDIVYKFWDKTWVSEQIFVKSFN